MIQNIAIEKLHEHVDNPRKDVGDVTELAESIKKSGVLQNLTVVPATGHYSGDYIVIIGHRRLAAAKIAGLKELPCAIVEMDKKEQVATMLLENMQRSDLTVYEQAQGMQMMMDLGDTVDDISEKTGFSSSTIRRRVKLLSLDEEKFKESEKRQITMGEYDKLFEIEDEDKRNELLGVIGTANFNNAFLAAKSDMERQKKKNEIISAISHFATEMSSVEINKYKYVTCIGNVKEIPQDREDVPYYYSSGWGANVYLYRDYTEAEKADNDEKKRKDEEYSKKAYELKEKRDEFNELSELFYTLRYDFIKTCSDLRKKANVLCEFAAWAMINSPAYHRIDIDELQKITKDGCISSNGGVIDYLEENPYRGLLYSAYLALGDDESNNFHDFYCKRSENLRLRTLYKYLIDLGYTMSDEEKAYFDGTHELFVKEEEE